MQKIVVSPNAIVRFREGSIWIHTGSRPQSLSFDDPAVLTLFTLFAHPRDREEALRLNEPDSDTIRKTIESLEEIGALVPAEQVVGDAADPQSDGQCMQQAHTHIASIARAVYEVAGDLLAYGPWCERSIAAESGMGVLARLESLVAAIDALRGELASRRERFAQLQLAQLGLADGQRALKLNIGAGDRPIESWINIDLHPAELAIDVRWGLPFVDDSVDYVFMSHVLEHLYYPDEVLPVVREIHRVLAPGGILRVAVPDIEKCINAYVEQDSAFFAERRRTWTWWPQTKSRLEDFLAYAGAGVRPEAFDSHKFGYDVETISQLLKSAGFADVQRSEYMQSRDPNLRIDDASPIAGARYRDQPYSLFVEARVGKA